jgi:hypothetical protein
MDNTETIETHLDEPLTPEKIAETVGVRVKLVILLVEHGLLETVDAQSEEKVLLPRHTILRLRKMQRLRRDLKVNYTGAGVILDMVEQMESMRHELAEMRVRFNL